MSVKTSPIGLIGAMSAEIEYLHAAATQASTSMLLGFECHTLEINQQTIYLLKSGIGKVSAAVSTTLFIQAYAPRLIINIGTAGAVNHDISIGDVVAATTLAYWDVDAEGFGYNYGQVPDQPATFHPPGELSAHLQGIKLPNARIHQGLLASGDSFISKEAQLSKIRSHFPDALAVDMESTSIAQTAAHLDTPLIVLRGISDYACGDALKEHQTNLALSSKHSSEAALALITQLTEK